jgi:hypothetical protein
LTESRPPDRLILWSLVPLSGHDGRSTAYPVESGAAPLWSLVPRLGVFPWSLVPDSNRRVKT